MHIPPHNINVHFWMQKLEMKTLNIRKKKNERESGTANQCHPCAKAPYKLGWEVATVTRRILRRRRRETLQWKNLHWWTYKTKQRILYYSVGSSFVQWAIWAKRYETAEDLFNGCKNSKGVAFLLWSFYKTALCNCLVVHCFKVLVSVIVIVWWANQRAAFSSY